jgi:hypothetical protein
MLKEREHWYPAGIPGIVWEIFALVVVRPSAICPYGVFVEVYPFVPLYVPPFQQYPMLLLFFSMHAVQFQRANPAVHVQLVGHA